MYGPHAAAGFHPLFLIFPILGFIVFVLVVVFVTMGARRRMRFWAARDRRMNDGALLAERTLAERFAKGDIDETEYRARLEVLRANRAPDDVWHGPGPVAPPRP